LYSSNQSAIAGDGNRQHCEETVHGEKKIYRERQNVVQKILSDRETVD